MSLEKKRVCANCLYQYQGQHQELEYDHFEQNRCKKNGEACGDTWNATCPDFVQKQKTLGNGLMVKGATLLTVEEAERLPEETRKMDGLWWLRSPGYLSGYTAYVRSDGFVDYYGSYVDYDCGAVRPVLMINLESSNLDIGDQFDFGGRKFEIISDTRALCTESIGDCAFREDWQVNDANDFEMSDVKKFVDGWYIQVMKNKTKGETT